LQLPWNSEQTNFVTRLLRHAGRGLLASLLLAAAASAHHGSASYDVTREIAVTGVVTEWRWTNPHVWIYLSVGGRDRTEEWNGEGPPLSWAQQRGWSSATLHKGEIVSLVMYPSKTDPRGGLVKRIEREGGEVLVVSRPWLDGRQ
jgi:hypothetical protein